MTDATASRRAALAVLEDVHRGVTFDDSRNRHWEHLSDDDRALAHELVAGVLRSRDTLDDHIKPLLRKRWDKTPTVLQDILRLGAYQITALDRVPDYAAVSTSVDLAREAMGNKNAKFVNAVLRQLARGGAETDRARFDELSARPEEGAGGARLEGRVLAGEAELAKQFSHPEWLVRRWVERYGAADTARLLEWNNTKPPLILQPIGRSNDELLAELRAAGLGAAAAPYGAGVVVEGGRPTDLPGYKEGHWIVQDAAQALVLRYADIPGNGAVYDACAAPGGKAVQLAVGRTVIAGDRTRERVDVLRSTLERTCVDVHAVVADGVHPPVSKVDVVFLDAPCTATGTMRRHPDTRYRLTEASIAQAVEWQRELLEVLAPIVRVGGLLIYSTCSIEPEENEVQVNGFLTRHAEFKREAPDTAPAELLGAEGDLVLLPQRHETDGAYAVRLRRGS